MSKWTSPTKRRKKARLNCERKVGHETPDAAQAALDDVACRGGLRSDEAAVYQCGFCHKFHWGNVFPETQAVLAAQRAAFKAVGASGR